MSNNNDSGNKYDAAFDAGVTNDAQNDKSKAESLLKFIQGVKDNAAYKNVDSHVSCDSKKDDKPETMSVEEIAKESIKISNPENTEEKETEIDSIVEKTDIAKEDTSPKANVIVDEKAEEVAKVQSPVEESTGVEKDTTVETPRALDVKEEVSNVNNTSDAKVQEDAALGVALDAKSEKEVAKDTLIVEEATVLTKTDEAIDIAEATEVDQKKEIDETAFNQGFNPSFAFFDNDTEVESKSSPIEEQVKSTVHEEAAPISPQEPQVVENVQEDKASSTTTTASIVENDSQKTFARRGKTERVSTKLEVPAKSKERKTTLSLASAKNMFKMKKSEKSSEPIKATSDPKKNADEKSANPLKSMSKKALAAVAVAIILVATITTGSILAAKGMIPAFASNEVYGIFVGDKLVAASKESGKIEEAIDDFLAHYKTLEEQGSIASLRISNPYEIRELSRDEIKDGIYSEKDAKTTKETVTPESGNSTTAPTGETQAATGETQAATQTTTGEAQTSGETTTAIPTTTTAAPQDGESTTHATTNQENPANKHGDTINITNSVEELKNILFYGSAPKPYTVVEGDNLSKIAKREGLTLTELMVPNPDLLEDSTIGIDQDILIVRMAGPLKLSFSREVTYTEDIPYKTVEEKSEDLFEGEKQTTQQGKEGIKQDVTKYDYENNVIAVKTPVSEDVIQEAVDKHVKVGTKKKTSENESSGLADNGDAGQPETSSGFGWPVNGARMTSKFGRRSAPKKGASSYHRGIDLAIGSGTPIYATQSGTVTIASYSGGYGNLVELNHGNGFTSRYGHCLSLKVKRGEKVQKGQLIALVGNTGVSTGPHVHFEIRKNGSAVNPMNYLK